MSRDKQIEEMAMVLTKSQHAFNKAWKECLHNNAPTPDRENVFYAKYLVEKEGYRKAYEVAEEIIKDLVKFADDKERQMSFHGHSVWYIDADDVTDFIAELKKKYTEGVE